MLSIHSYSHSEHKYPLKSLSKNAVTSIVPFYLIVSLLSL